MVDLIAIKKGKILGFECKRREKGYFNIKELSLKALDYFEKTTGGKAYLCLYFNDRILRFYSLGIIKKYIQKGIFKIDKNTPFLKLRDITSKNKTLDA